MGAQYYIRVRGRKVGPLSVEKLHSLARRGRFGRHYEVSTDGKRWESAANFPELFSDGLDDDFESHDDDEEDGPPPPPPDPNPRPAKRRRRNSPVGFDDADQTVPLYQGPVTAEPVHDNATPETVTDLTPLVDAVDSAPPDDASDLPAPNPPAPPEQDEDGAAHRKPARQKRRRKTAGRKPDRLDDRETRQPEQQDLDDARNPAASSVSFAATRRLRI